MKEYVTDGGWDSVRRNFETLKQTVIDTGGQSLGIRAGSGTLTFPGGSVNTGALTVSHGLGKAPVSVQLTAIAAATPLDVFVVSADADSFDARGRTTDGTSPVAASTQTFYWLAVG